jgi:phosphatidylglycerophosphate synthase
MDSETRRLVALSFLTMIFGSVLLALIFYGPEHPNATQQVALNTLLVFCGAAGVELIRGFQRLLSSRRSSQRKRPN